MNTLRPLVLASLGAAALVAATALPATAADTTATFALAGGALSIAVQPDAALTNGASGAASVSGQLGNVDVTDLRGGTTNWSADGSSTAFTTGTLPNTNPTSTGVTYNTGAVSFTGDSTIVNSGDHALTTAPSKVAGPTSIVGNNTASWNPTLTVALPANALSGNYSGTVTTSVS
jgi:hypothetical protein